jgi:hypothetical protein
LEEARTAFERLPRDEERIAVAAGVGIDDDVEAAETLFAQSWAQERDSRLRAASRPGRFFCRVREVGRTRSVSA